MTARRWNELTAGQQTGIRVASTVQIALAISAWVDLAHRPAALVNGRKAVWAGIIGVNFVGPMAYFARGRRRRA